MNRNDTYNKDLSFKYLIDHGISNKIGDLYYKQLINGAYVVLWVSCRDIDVHLCKWLPDNHEDINDSNTLWKISGFNSNNAEKVKEFKSNILCIDI